ncbi:MAG: transposase [Firmicutes bacterium]|nr:transposase [Bacillota bacterium]
MTDTSNSIDYKLEYEKMCRSFSSLSNKYDRALKKIEIKDKKIGELNVKIIKFERDKKLSDSVYKRQIKEHECTIAGLKKQLEEKDQIILKLKAQIERDYTTSSIPSSMKPNHKKISNSRTKSGRKPGAQPNHKHHPRKMLETTAEPVVLDIPSEVKENPDDYVFVRNVSRKVVNISVSTEVVEYIGSEYRLKGTSKTIRSEFPKGVHDEINYGPSVKALCCLLNNYCNVSIRKVREVISGLTDNRIEPSIGKINGLTKEFSCNTSKERNEIFNQLFVSTYQNTDATYLRRNGETVYVYVSTNKDSTFYTFKTKKGEEGIIGTPVEGYEGVLVTDHDKTYFKYGYGHQKCLAHELRYIKDSITNEPEREWNKKMEVLLKDIIHKFKNGQREFNDELDEYDKIIEIGEKEYADKPPSKYYRNGYNTFKRMRDYKAYVFYFLKHPEILYTNNDAERKLRQVKRKSKQVGAFRADESISNYCDFMTIIETANNKNENIYQILLNNF